MHYKEWRAEENKRRTERLAADAVMGRAKVQEAIERLRERMPKKFPWERKKGSK